MTLAKKTDYLEQALDRLLEQYKQKPKIEGLISPWLGWIQVLEDIVWEIITLRYIDTAEGVQLDVLGKILGAPRAGLSDTAYRIRLKAQGIILRSHGTPPELETLLQLCCPYTFTFEDSYIATLLIELTETVDPDAFDIAVLWDVLLEAKDGGIRLELTWTEESNVFRLADYDPTFTPVFSSEHGLSGGKLASVFST